MASKVQCSFLSVSVESVEFFSFVYNFDNYLPEVVQSHCDTPYQKNAHSCVNLLVPRKLRDKKKTETMTEPIFRKRGTGKKTVRKKNNAEASVGDAQTDRDSDLRYALMSANLACLFNGGYPSVALRETRQIQRERARGKGCEASATRYASISYTRRLLMLIKNSDEVLSLIAARGGGYSVVTDEESKESGLQSTFIVQQDDGKDVNPLLYDILSFHPLRLSTIFHKAE